MIRVKHPQDLRSVAQLEPQQPLWQRVPTRTDAGEPAADFMMLVRKLNRMAHVQQQRIMDMLFDVLQRYSDLILLADMNMKMNLLWVSHVPRPGLGLEIASMLHHAVPEARLISHYIHR